MRYIIVGYYKHTAKFQNNLISKIIISKIGNFQTQVTNNDQEILNVW